MFEPGHVHQCVWILKNRCKRHVISVVRVDKVIKGLYKVCKEAYSKIVTPVKLASEGIESGESVRSNSVEGIFVLNLCRTNQQFIHVASERETNS